MSQNSDNIKYLGHLSALRGKIEGARTAAESMGRRVSLTVEETMAVERVLSAYARIIEITTYEPYEESLIWTDGPSCTPPA